jgi:hypothetical protein
MTERSRKPTAAGALYDLGSGLPFLAGAALAGLAMGAVGTTGTRSSAGPDARMPADRGNKKGRP